MSNKSNSPVATMGIDIGKNAFHVVGLDRRCPAKYVRPYSKGQKNDFATPKQSPRRYSARR